jgi:hypothetical protein
LTFDSSILDAFRDGSLEIEVAQEVIHLPPKFGCNPLGESGDRLVGKEVVSAGCVFPVCLGETGLTGLGNKSDRFWS